MKSISDNERFIYLLVVANEDPEIKDRLLKTLMEDDLTRMDLLNEWITHGKTKGAPKDFLEALEYLKDPFIAYKAIDAISGNL